MRRATGHATGHATGLALLLAACWLPVAAQAQHRSTPQPLPAPDPAGLASGLDGTFIACESWILDPSSWTGEEGLAPLIELSGLGRRIMPVPSVIDAALPPVEYRRANHYFRINATAGEGFYLVVSDQVPMCHITGGGLNIMQPVADQVLTSPAFTHRWEQVAETREDGLVSTSYQHRLEPRLTIIVTRADGNGRPTDLMQLIATAQYDMGG